MDVHFGKNKPCFAPAGHPVPDQRGAFSCNCSPHSCNLIAAKDFLGKQKQETSPQEVPQLRGLPMRKENRKHLRSKVQCPVEFMTSSGSMYGEIRNLSKGGAFISSSKVIDPLNDFPVVISPQKGKYLIAMANLYTAS